MSTDERNGLKDSLVLALAEGRPAAQWASANGVNVRTAQRWAVEPEVRAEVELYRRSAMDEAMGRMSKRVAWAADQIAELAGSARSESVKLAAARSILKETMAITEFVAFEQRITRLEEQDRERHKGNPTVAD